MYQPKKYQKNDPEYIFEFIKAHPFATLVSNGDRLLATHIPILTDGKAEDFRLFGHIANHNEQLAYLKEEPEILLIFLGAHAYVSSSWYTEKNISTWDYSAVHVSAKIKIQTTEEMDYSLQKLVNHFEGNQQNPLYPNDIPEKIWQDHLPQITGFWCLPNKVEAIAKLHQHYKKEDIQRITKELDGKRDTSAKELSNAMKREHGLDH